MTTAAAHRHTRQADRLINRLQAIMIAGADLVAELDDERALYVTSAGRYFILDAAGPHPITAPEAARLTAPPN